MIQKILSKQNPKIKDVISLQKAANREEKKEFIIEGKHLLEMAIESKLVKCIFTLKGIKKIPETITQYIITPQILDKISNEKTSQGIVAICQMPTFKKNYSNKILYLDDVSDPGNIGTLLRTALAFNFYTVILSKNSCSAYNPKVVQSSQGAIFKLNVIEGGVDTLKRLKKQNYQIFATELKSSKLIESVKPTGKYLIVLGNEAHGVSQKILDIADFRIRISINNIESLNVGVAGGIAMYQLSKK